MYYNGDAIAKDGLIYLAIGLAVGLLLGWVGPQLDDVVFTGEGETLSDSQISHASTQLPSLINGTFRNDARPESITTEQGIGLHGNTGNRTDLYVRDRDTFYATHWRIGGMHNWAGVIFEENTTSIIDRRYYTEFPVPDVEAQSLEFSRLFQNILMRSLEEDELRCSYRTRAPGRVYECQWYETTDGTADGRVYQYVPDEDIIRLVGCHRTSSSPFFNDDSCLLGPGGVL